MGTYLGWYRAQVKAVNAVRVRLLIPTILGDSLSGWADPISGPLAALHPPLVGQIVYVTFEQGDLNRPLYMP